MNTSKNLRSDKFSLRKLRHLSGQKFNSPEFLEEFIILIFLR